MRVTFLALCLVLSLAACKDKTVTPQMSDLKFTIHPNQVMTVSLTTNLPDGVNLAGCLQQQEGTTWRCRHFAESMDYPNEPFPTLKNGRWEAGFPSILEKGLEAGTYRFEIAIVPGQDEKLLGPKNAWLQGDGVSMAGAYKEWHLHSPPTQFQALPAHPELLPKPDPSASWNGKLPDEK